MFVFTPSCSKNKPTAAAIENRDSLPGMQTFGVSTLISDSGIIRYKIVAEQWDIFDKKDPSYWAFEKGIHLEKFDTTFRVDAEISADTAYYYDKNKLWELRSNVAILSLAGDKFHTDQMFWNEQTGRIYSDKKIRIEQPDKMIVGTGFDSNQQLTDYTIHETSGIFIVEDTAPTDTLSADTTSAAAAAPSAPDNTSEEKPHH